MADVTGPISSLPGSLHKAPDGAMCDDHPKVRAVIRLQGETDSLGSEMHDLCQPCLDKCNAEHDKYAAIVASGVCDWCGSQATDLRDHRDFEEGSAGRIYEVCGRLCEKRKRETA